VLIPVLALLMLLGTGCSEKDTTAPQEVVTEQAPAPEMAEAEAPPPVEAPEPAAEPAADTQAAAGAADGQKVYQASCQACHVAGVAGAPKTGDKEAWAPRIAKGNDALLSSVKGGLNAMPPMGGCMTCSDAELSAGIAYLVEQGS
jgi:cytochrome c5